MAGAPKKWQDRVILADEHGPELTQRAAELEFKERLHREAAEAQAYREYHRKHVLAAAAHHLRGMKAAQATGDTDEARKHGAMYEMHMGKLGLDPWQEPPRELKSAMTADDRSAAHKFRAHPGDTFVVEEHKAKQAAKLVKNQLEELHLKAKAIVLLRKAFPTDPTKPVGEGVSPDLRQRYKMAANSPPGAARAAHRAQLRSTMSDDIDQIKAANKFRPGTPISTAIEPGAKATPAQRGLAAGIAAAPPETKVALDFLTERGFQPETPPRFKVAGTASHWAFRGTPATHEDLYTYNWDAIHRHNEAEGQKIGTGMGVPPGSATAHGGIREPAAGYLGQGKMWFKDPNAPGQLVGLTMDRAFWDALSRSAGLPHGEPIKSPEEAAQFEQQVEQAKLKRSLVEIVDLAKAFPIDPDRPITSHLGPHQMRVYRSSAKKPEQLVNESNKQLQQIKVETLAGTAPTHIGGEPTQTVARDLARIAEGNKLRPTTPAGTMPPSGKPTAAQRGIQEMMAGASSEQRVEIDRFLEQGAGEPSLPPKFVEKPQPNLATHGMDDPAFANSADAHGHNWEQNAQLYNQGTQDVYHLGDQMITRRPAGEWKKTRKGFDPRLHIDNQFWEALGRAAGVNKTLSEIVDLIKAFPSDPTKPVASHLAPETRAGIRAESLPNAEIAQHYHAIARAQQSRPWGTIQPRLDAEAIEAANTPRPSKRAGFIAPGKQPTKAQQQIAEMVHGASSEQRVEMDQFLEHGAGEPSLPPKFGEPLAPFVHFQYQNEHDRIRNALAHNAETLHAEGLTGSSDPTPADAQPAAWQVNPRNAWKGKDAALSRRMDRNFWEALGRAVGTEQVKKHFPTDPTKPVGHDLEPELEDKYLTHAAQPHQIAANTPHGEAVMANTMLAGKKISTAVPPGKQPTKDQRNLAAGLAAAPMETKVAIDNLTEQGFSFEKPQNVPMGGALGGAHGFPSASQHNVQSLSAMDAHLGEDGPRPLINPPEPAVNTPVGESPWSRNKRMRTVRGAPELVTTGSNYQYSKWHDQAFWDAVSRSVGLPAGKPITSPEQAQQFEQQLADAQKLGKISIPFFKPKKPAGMHTPAPAAAGVAPGVRPYEPMPQADVEARKKIFASIPPKPTPKPITPSAEAPTVASPARQKAGAAAPAKPALPSTIPGYGIKETAGLQRILATTPRDPSRNVKAELEIVDLVKSQPEERAGDGVPCACPRDACGTHSHENGKCNHCQDVSNLLQIVDLAKSLDTHSPVFKPGQLVGHEGRNLVVVKVHEGHGLGQPHLYTLRDPVDNSLSHAFEAKLTPTKEQNHGRD